MAKDRVILAYSGGLDTSCILAYLLDQGFEVLAYMANIGQEEDFEAAKEKALKIGASQVFIEDLRSEFIDTLVWPAVQANALYEGIYLLGTALARPVIAARQIELAKKHNCNYVSHGCTGKGNDQVRFELGYYALQPSIKVIAPWRTPEFYTRFPGRQALLAYAAEKGIPVVQTAAKPWSTDENIFHISYEAGILEDPATVPPKDMWKLTVDPEDAVDAAEHIEIEFTGGVPTKATSLATKESHSGSLDLFTYLNSLGRKHGVGRIDIVENRFIGIKSRGCYESPAATILRAAHLDLEGLTLDREVRKLKDQLGQRLADVLYNGLWFSAEREFLVNAISHSQKLVDGTVKLKLYKGSVSIEGRSSPNSLYDQRIASMDETDGFEPKDSGGFINIQKIRLIAYQNQKTHAGLE